MRRPGGYTFETTLDGAVIEGETYTCMHCNRITMVKPGQRPEDIGGLCKQCMGLVCSQCLETSGCDPLEKKLNEALEKSLRLKEYGLF